MSIDILITNQTGGGLKGAWLKTKLHAVVKRLGVRSCEWSITIVPDATMATLHKKTMNIPGTTDVLTFDLRDAIPRAGKEGDPVELDTVLCRDEACRRAKEFHHSTTHELLLYSVHSLLHVQGYNDTTPRKSKIMHAREDQLLQSLGLAPLYTGAART